MKIGKRPLKLLRAVFTRKGKVMCSGVDTDRGKLLDWLRLENAGLVKRKTPSMRSALGHDFSFDITPEGKTVAEAPENKLQKD